ncbi:Gfo/Idh/MocA family protein [Vibrio mexicanus]|uniref:Gfo/Idh/MocA family protein n=1 Tax=Vibrio mexicanus TaxID=1004326 RepID=UPI00063C62EE|nr:Gfo/Idh/MocA family oxidoreductase [Vibrio mexicanus]
MKIGIIGLGDIAQKAYLPVITQKTGIELVFCTRQPETVKRLSQQYRINEYCTQYQDLLKHSVDAVMIHAATAVHHEIAQFFLSHNIPTFVDKPLADSAAQCEELYDIADKHQQPLYVGFNRRHIPLYNQQLPSLQKGQQSDLRVMRWEKHRHNLPGELRTFVFDDFIHALDSVNLAAKATLEGVNLNIAKEGSQLSRIDVSWQHQDTIYQASMNRQFGITRERMSVALVNQSYEFDSFVSGKKWIDGQEHQVALKDWTPMLSSKGFDAMLEDWFAVVRSGKLPTHTAQRNLATHQLAEAILNEIER